MSQPSPPGNESYRYSNLPEVIPGTQATSVGGTSPYSNSDAFPSGLEPVYESNLPQVVDKPEDSQGDGARNSGSGAPAGPWWKRRRNQVLLGVVVLCLIVVAAVVGGVVGSRQSHSKSQNDSDGDSHSDDSSSPTSTSSAEFGTPTTFDSEELGDSTCAGTMCPRLLSVASDEDGSTVMVFARASDDTIWYRRIRGGGWDDNWETLEGTYTYSSQPVALSLGKGSITVIAVSDNSTGFSRTFTDGDGWSDEETVGLDCESYISAATWNTGVAEAYCISDAKIYDVSYKASSWDIHNVAGYGSPGHIEPPALSSPELGYLFAGVLWSGDSGEKMGVGVKIMTPNDLDKTGFVGLWGDFRGQPETVALSTTRVEYFAVGRGTGNIWHSTWISHRANGSDDASERDEWGPDLPNEYTIPVPYPGESWSVPVAAYIPSLSRIDVFFVAANGSLMHGTMIGGTWQNFAGDDEDINGPWESLGGHFNSAPSIWVNDTTSLVVFGLGPAGSLIHSTFTAQDDERLGPGKWYDDGGELNTHWLVNGTQIPEDE